MSLLQEIQDAAVDASVPISTLLRKCAVLAARLNNDELRAWVAKELNGYENDADTPDYRILGAHATGHLAGPFGSGYKNITIPPMVLPEWGRKFAEQVRFTQPIATVEGIGPHPEDRAVDLIVKELKVAQPAWHSQVRVCYPGSKTACDWLLGDPVEWAIEIKMARPNGDNGKPDDTAIKDILSPFAADRSAVTDCSKLAESDVAPRKALLIYGFDDRRRPLSQMIEAFEILAGTRVRLGERHSASFSGLVHPVHAAGGVVGWEVLGLHQQ